ncbi:MAG: Na(+)/H(+) antiporter subunit C [Actinomycetia bacterium]|nr:Na(+)/H(+) antiporter subunit C [Actinomycetes bacterium]
MTVYLIPLIIAGGLMSCGVYLLLSRNLTRMLLGLLLVSNAVSLLLLTIGGPSGNPPVRGRTSGQEAATADPLAQALILTAIVITMGVAAFVLALIYRSYRLTAEEDVTNDPEDTRVAQLSDADAAWTDADRGGAMAYPDTEAPDELDALPGSEGSR